MSPFAAPPALARCMPDRLLEACCLNMRHLEFLPSAVELRRRRAASSPRGTVAVGPDRRRRARSADEVGVAVCFLVLCVVVVLGGALMLFSWVTTVLPLNPAMPCAGLDGCTDAAMPCPGFDGCVTESSSGAQVVSPVDQSSQEPMATRELIPMP
jgi:hypothetical protein